MSPPPFILACCSLLTCFFFQSLVAAAELRILGDPQRIANGVWRISWESEPGREYVLQTWNGDDLAAVKSPRWIDVSRVTAVSTLASADDLTAGGTRQRFYRIIEADAAEIVIVRSPQLTPQGWKITWTALPGNTYALERWTSDALGVDSIPRWTEITRLTANGPEASAIDPASPISGQTQRYYRVRLVTDNIGDFQAPTVSAIEVTELNGGQSLMLRVTAIDNVGVDSVVFLDGDLVLGPGGTIDEGIYGITVPYDPQRETTPYFVARAIDAAGNAGYSPVLRYGLAEKNRFAVVDDNGNPTGEYIEPNPDGTLPPFEYRPGGRNALGANRELSIKFGDGARLVVINGREFIEFNEAEANFGVDSPIQFLPRDSALAAAAGARSARLRTAANESKLLPLGPLQMEDLAAVLDYDPALGIPVTFFGKFPMLWKGGTLEDYGIAAPLFTFLDDNFPLPAVSGRFAGYKLNLLENREIALPFYGEFDLPDGTGASAKVRVSASRPIWLRLTADGELSLEGRVELEFASGTRFTADLVLDDPVYQLKISYNTAAHAALARTDTLLPESISGTLQLSLNAAELDNAAEILSAKAGELLDLNASVLASLPYAVLENHLLPLEPPHHTEYTASLPRILAELEGGTGTSSLLELILAMEKAAPRLESLSSALDQCIRLRELVSQFNSSGQPASDPTLQLLTSAAEKTFNQVLALLASSDSLSSLSGMSEAAELLAQLATSSMLSGPESEALSLELPQLANRLASAYARAVQSSEEDFVIAPAPDRATLLAQFLLGAKLATALANIDAAGDVPADLRTALGSVAERYAPLVLTAFTDAETSADLMGFALTFAELLEILQLAETPSLSGSPGLDALPDTAELTTLVSRLETLLQLLPSEFQLPRSLSWQSSLIDRLLKIRKRLPEAVTFDGSPLLPALNRLQGEINAFIAAGSANQTNSNLREVIEAALINVKGRRVLNQDLGAWLIQLPGLINSLTQEAVQHGDFSSLHQVASMLQDAASDLRETGDAELRMLYLQQIARLLDSSRRIFSTRVNEILALPDFLPDFASADLHLPGGMVVHRASGAAEFHRISRKFSGSFSGEIEFPEFGARLSILQGDLNSGGEFQVTGHGEVSFPLENPVATISILESDPLFISYTRNEGLRISGGASFEFQSGLYFRGSIGLLDPLYHFSLEAGGLKFDLLDAITFNIPALPDISGISEEGLDLFNALLTSLGGSAGAVDSQIPLGALGQNLNAAAAGPEPVFPGANSADPLTALEAWANYLAVKAMLGETIDPSATYDVVNRLIKNSGEALQKEFAEFQRLTAEQSPLRAFANNSPRRALQFDFGSSEFPYLGQGPAHQLDLFDPDDTTWNIVGVDRSTGLLWADGSIAPGISIDLGRLIPNSSIVDWNFAPPTSQFFQLFEELPIGQTPETYPGFNLFRDGIVSMSGSQLTTVPSAIAVRLRGLAPGYFVAFPVAFNSVVSPGSYTVSIGRENRLLAAPPIVATTDHFPIWSANVHYTGFGAGLSDPADDLVVVIGPGPQLAVPVGRIQGLQVIETLPEIISFSASPTNLNFGQSSALEWQTAFATSVKIDSGVGSVDSAGSRQVSPQITTRFTLTASNPSGSVSTSVVVHLPSASLQIAKITESLERMNATYRRVAEHLDQVAEQMLLGKDAFIDTEQMQGQLDANAEIYRQLISPGNAAAHQDKEVVEKLAQAGLDLAANYAILGLQENLGTDEIRQFLERTVEAFENRLGSISQSGEIDSAKVAASSSDESLQAMSDLIDFSATLAAVGSEKVLPENLIIAHATNAQAKLLGSLQFNPATGAVNLAGKSETETGSLLSKLLEIDGTKSILEEPSTVPPATYAQIGTHLQEQALARLRVLGAGKWKPRFASLRNLEGGNELRARAGLEPRYLPEIRWENANLARQINAQASAQARLTDSEFEALNYLEAFLSDPEVAPEFTERVRKSLRGIDALLSRAWSEADLEKGEVLLAELADLYLQIRRIDPTGQAFGLSTELMPQQLIIRLGERFVTAGRAHRANDQLVAFSEAALSAQARLQLQILPLGAVRVQAIDPAITALKNVSHLATSAATDLTREWLDFLESSESIRPIDLQMPGDLAVERVFGHLFYNRDTGFLQGGFGGRLEFPDIAAAIELTDATIANDGSFSFSGETEAPLPFGDIRVTTSLSAEGKIGTAFMISGEGQMVIPGENGDQIIDVTTSYDSAGRRLQFDSGTSDTTLRFSDDFVVFDAGLGLEVSGTSPAGRLVLSGTAGLFSKLQPLPATLTTDHFHLAILNTSVDSELSTNGFDLKLERGTLLLPDLFSASHCLSNNLNTSFVARASATVSPESPIFVSHRANPLSTSFGGALLFQNIGVHVPGIEDLSISVCEMVLQFNQGELPRMFNVSGFVSLPLPQDTVILEIQDAAWDLNGLPVGKVRLEDNVTLLSNGGFSLEILGANQDGCSEAGFTITETAAGHNEFLLQGGMELQVPLTALSDEQGNAVKMAACGSMFISTNNVPALVLDSAFVEGNFKVGGSNGFQIKNARVTARNIGQLIDSDSTGDPFQLIIESGRLELANGGFFQINQGEISLDGTFLIDATAGSGSSLDFAGVSITASVFASGGPQQPFQFEGSGELEVIESGQKFAVNLAYDHDLGRLAFDSQTENLNLRLGDNFVIFDAGFGFEVTTSAPNGRMAVRGTAGLFAKSVPLPQSISPEDFHLVIDQVETVLAYTPEGFSASLANGLLMLPDFFRAEICDPAQEPTTESPRASIALAPGNPIFVQYSTTTGKIEFGGAIAFNDIGFEVPGIDGLKVAVCQANLAFSSAALPVLSDLSASVQIPLPEGPAIVDFEDGEWALDGFPTGTISLRNDLLLLDQGGFTLTLLGGESPLCPAGTALTISRNAGQPTFRLDGGLRFSVPANILSDEAGGEIFTAFCSGVEFGFQQAPRLEIAAIAIGLEGNSTFRLGGSGGLLITGALLQAQGIQNLFNQSEQEPFILTLSGGFQIPDGPGFALNNAQFTFVGEPLPGFSLGGATLNTGETFEAAAGLPLTISEAGFSFKNQNLPLPDLLAPENLVITLSASLGLPPEQPVVSGQVQGLTVTLDNGVPVVHVSGIGLGIQDFEIPPLSLTGQVFIGGLGPGEDIYFAGNVGGTLQGAGVTALLAFNLQGPLGCCFSVNAGPAGIPLGPSGFLFTGAQGGVSFLNTNGDPCEFRTFINVDDATGRPVENGNAPLSIQSARPRIAQMHAMTWDQLRAQQERQHLYDLAIEAGIPTTQPVSPVVAPQEPALQAFAGEPAEFPCPTGDCPPETINILCQVHPDLDLYPDRVIVKFTSLTEADLESIGITRGWVESSGLTTAPEIAEAVASNITNFLNSITPRPPLNFTGPNGEPIGQQLNALLDEVMINVHLALRGSLTSAVQSALGENRNVFDAILGAAYAGVGCPDATVKLTGTFSHAAVSSFLSGTGGAVLSTTGSAGLVGTVNLFGIPVGFLDGFVNATDSNGDPNPSMCGHVRFALGPLELGQLKALNQCEGCITGVLGSFASLADCLSEELFSAIIPKVAPHLASLPRAQALNAMTDDEKLAFLAEWFSLPPQPGAADCFLTLVADSLDSLNPEFTLCGAVQPKLFGFPLAGSAIEVAVAADKSSMAGQFAFSSSLLMGSYGALFPLGDQASFGFGVAWPNPDELILGALSGRFSSPAAIAQYLEDGFAYMLENATYTVGYELSPFGLKGFQSGARVVMPNLTDHPEISGWIPPEERPGDLPSRLELMLAAVENEVLANPLWKGTSDDIHLAFPDGDPRRQAVQGLSFARDYFPHGGVVGAARLGLPRAITDSPPAETIELILNPGGDILARLGAAMDYVQNYILTSSEVGTLGFYIPAPNPPILLDGQGNPIPPQEMLASIMSFDPSIGFSSEIYPLERAFLQGYMDGRLLGIPIARASVLGEPPTETEEGRLVVSADIPEGSWMRDFVESANMAFEVRQAPVLPIEEQFIQIADSLQDVLDSGSVQDRQLFLENFSDQLAASMPKVSLDLAVNNLRIPATLEPILSLDGSSSARFVAYSPRFDPEAVGNSPIVQARRLGGVALQARLRFADLITIENAELAVLAGLPNPVTGLPPLAGLFDVPQLPIPLTSLVLQNVQLAFNSDPAAGQPFLSGSGSVNPISIEPLLAIIPLQTNETRLSASLNIVRQSSNSLASSVRINPARLSMPAFAEGLRVEIHGSGETDPFTLSTEGLWSATVSLKGGLVLRDPAGVPVLRVGDPAQTFSAALSGNALESATISLSLPAGIQITTFPGLSVEQSFPIGSVGTAAHLTISSDGTFELTGDLAGNLALDGLPVEQINAGASIRVTEASLIISGAMSGGDLDSVNLGSADASLVVTKQGISLNGSISLAPLQFGVFRISGLNGGNISAVLDNNGLRIESGARLAVHGIAEQLLVLEEFVIGDNGNFSAAVTSGEVTIPNYFKLSEGSNRIERVSGVTRFEMVSPRFTVFPGTPYQTLLPAPLERLLIESNGRFYYDSGSQTIALPHTFSAGGRLEFGWEPDATAPLLAVNTSPIQFGLIDTGTSASRSLTVRNDGGSQLLVSALSSDAQTFTVAPVLLPLAPGEQASFEVRFFASDPGTVNGALTLTHNTATSPTTISLSGQGRAVPVYYQSANNLDFGEQPVGGGAVRQLIVANLGTAPLEIDSVSVPPPFSAPATGFTVQPGDFRRLLVTFHSTAVGPFTGTMKLKSAHDGTEHPVQLSGNGSQQRWWIQRDGGSPLRSIDHGFAVGDDGQLLSMNIVSQDGDRWTPLPSLGNIRLHRVYGRPDGLGPTYAVGRSGVVLRYESLRWTPISDPVVANGANQFLGVATYWPSQLLMLVGEGGRMVREHDFGAFSTVTSGTLEDLHDVAFSANAAFGIAVGSDGTILRSINQGASWTAISLPAGMNGINLTLRAVDINSSGVAVIVGDNGTVLRSSANGLNWSKITVPTDRHLFDVRTVGTEAYAVGDSGVFMLSSNSALSWQIEGTRAGTRNLYGVYARDGKVWTVGHNGFIQHRPIEPPAGPILGFSTGLLDFGNLPVGAVIQRTASIYNRGTDTLEISNIQGNDLFSVSETSLSILPGEQKLLRVYFHPKEISDTDPGNPTRVIVFNTNDPDGVHYLGVRGTSHPSVWRQVSSATDQHLREVQFPTSLVGYAIFDDGIIKTADGGTTWTNLSLPSSGSVRALHFLTANQGLVGGGENGLPFILRTENGGASWTSASLAFGIDGPITDLTVAPGEDSRGYAVTASFTTGQLTRQGQVLRTLNAGSSWTVVPGIPDTFFNGAVSHSYSPFSVLVSSGGTLYRSTDSGSSWQTLFNLGGAFPIQAISSVDTRNTFVGGLNGLLRRASSITPTPPVFTSPAVFSSGAIQDVHFATLDRGWCAIAGAGSGGVATIFGTSDGGLTWREEFSVSGGINSIWALSQDLAFAVGTDGRIWKYEPFSEKLGGIASLPALLDFGEQAPCAIVEKEVQIANIGASPLVLHNVTMDSGSAAEAFAVTPLRETVLDPGESTSVRVTFQANLPGTYNASLILGAQGSQQDLVTELRATVHAPSQLVIFLSEPPGLDLVIDGEVHTTPVAFPVLSGSSTPGGWTPGSVHSISAPDQQLLGEVPYVFQDWSPANSPQFSIVASSSVSQTVTARFVRKISAPLSAAGAPGSSLSGNSAGFKAMAVSPPADVPAGPWLKLSQASIQAPALGSIDLQGAVFLSATSFSASLANAAVRLPLDTDLPELLEITAGSWQLDFTTTPVSRMRLAANSPGLELFDHITSPPSELLFDFASNGHFTAAFSTSDDTPLLPGVFSIGPGAVTLKADPFFSLDLQGNIRILQKPDGTWAVNQAYDFTAAEGPFTHDFASLPPTLLDLGFSALKANSSSAIRLARDNSGTFSIHVINLQLDLFGRTFSSISGGVDSLGLLSLSLAPPASPFAIGPMRLAPNTTSTFDWKLLSGEVAVHLSASKLRAAGVTGWPSEGIDFPAFSLDTEGNFERKIALPSFNFNGIDIASGGLLADNYLLFKRQDGIVSLKVRDERSLFGNNLKLALDVSANGSVSGSFSGVFGINTSVFGRLEFGSISLNYDSAEPDYQFQGRFRQVQNDFGLFYGSAGGKFSHLNCTGPDLEDCSTGLFEFTSP